MSKFSQVKILTIFLIVLFSCLGLPGVAFAEQLTTVAIIDVGEVYEAFPTEARGLENLTQLKTTYQKEINDLVNNLDLLKREKVQALKEENYSKADSLDSQINNLIKYIDSLSKQRQSDLVRRSQSPVSKEFLDKVQSAISYVAEEKGYTLVLQSTMDGIQWFAPVINITEDVIKRLKQ